MRAEIVKWWPDRGYGFAKPEHGDHDLIVHLDRIIEGKPYQGAMIECDVLGTNMNRRRKADNIKVLARV